LVLSDGFFCSSFVRCSSRNVSLFRIFVAYAAMLCDLDKTANRSCVLRSPLMPSTFNWTCVVVSYQLSSSDVKLQLDFLDDGVSFESYILFANQTAIWIENPNRETSIGIQLTAKRYLVSTADYEDARVSSVAYLPCQSSVGMLKDEHDQSCLCQRVT